MTRKVTYVRKIAGEEIHRTFIAGLHEDQQSLGLRIASELKAQFSDVVKARLEREKEPHNVQWAVFARIEPTPGWRYEGMCFDEETLGQMVRAIEHDIRRGLESPPVQNVLPAHTGRRTVDYKLVPLENPCSHT